MDIIIYANSDHRGYRLQREAVEYLKSKRYRVVDLSPQGPVPNNDYPIRAEELCKKVHANKGSVGILVCGSGRGMALAANKIRGIRAASCDDVAQTESARKDLDINVICLGADIISKFNIPPILDAFLNTSFSEAERHIRRIRQVAQLEAGRSIKSGNIL